MSSENQSKGKGSCDDVLQMQKDYDEKTHPVAELTNTPVYRPYHYF